ncbi:hypothetical protein GCM10009742_21720 [Kribbella karoonensis]|uniref:Conjugative transposon protein TcpC n=2 Tax=Kribbellaceae TaxID=2726069 RepID=A0ABP4PBR0_9ACTN
MSWWRTVLNLPPKGEHWSDQRRTKKPGKGRPQSTAPEWWAHPGGPVSPTPRQAQGVAAQYSAPQNQTPPPNGGVMAPPRRPGGRTPDSAPQQPGPRPPERLKQRSPHGAHAAPGAPPREVLAPGQTPWSTEPESSFSTWARRFFRGLVVVVLLLAAISGIRSWIAPNRTPQTVVSGQSSFPSDEARAVATRYAVAYLTWDENNPDARPAQVGLDLAAGLDGRAGWNGRGKQTADVAYPGQVTADQNGITAVVDVRVRVHTFNRQGGNAFTAGPVVWDRLSVPVALTSARVVVSGPPTFVPDERAPLPANMPESGKPDDDLTSATEKDAEAFFAAYAESDNKVSAVTAPGSTIRSLNGAVKFGELKDWQVYAGNDDERQATAAVTWDGVGDTTLDQTYTLTLRRTVATDGAQRWQVAAVG